jgi:hypothetical protein
MNSRNLFAAVICAILALATRSAAALDQNAPADDRLPIDSNGEVSRPALSETITDQPQDTGGCDVGCWQSCAGPRWTAEADFIILDRIAGPSQTLVDRVPRSVRFGDLFTTPGTESLNMNDFQQGFAAGPQIDLIRHGDCGYDLELSYYQINGWHSDKNAGPDDPADWLVMRAPGLWLATTTPGGYQGWIQTNQRDDQALAWDYSSRLYDAEFNVRWHPLSHLTVLSGFRWVEMDENLVGALSPPTMVEPPFWNTTTTNNLFGFQTGVDWKIWERGRFSIDGLVKAGIYDNDAEQTSVVSVIAKTLYPASDSTNHAAFVGDTGLQCKYQLTKDLALKASYQVLCLEGVALAPGQIQETYSVTRFPDKPSSVQALGINCNGGVFYQGATAGLEYLF